MELNVRALLKNVQFPGDDDPTYDLAMCGSTERKHLVADYKGVTIQSKIAAVIEIQRTWRGHRLRKRLKNILERFLLTDDVHEENTSHDVSHDANIKTLVRDTRLSETIKKWSQDLQSDTAIKNEQGQKDRTRDSPSVIEQLRSPLDSLISEGQISHDSHVTIIQEKEHRQWTPQTAAMIIQRTWRRYSDMKVFKYFKGLLHFQNSKCDLNQLLKCVIPAESSLIDKASGGFVRFRLGGATFPPTIFFKIFTHRSVIDMCSFSPRDYTAMSERKMLCKDVNNKEPRAVPLTDKEKWYQRIENNGWRPLTNNAIVSDNMLVCSTSRKSVPFHYNKKQRRQNVKVLKKRKKIQWMKQMYKIGLEQDQSIPHCVTPNTRPQSAITPCDEEELHEEDVDELLQWTQELDYDNYLRYWGELATSCIDNSNTHT